MFVVDCVFYGMLPTPTNVLFAAGVMLLFVPSILKLLASLSTFRYSTAPMGEVLPASASGVDCGVSSRIPAYILRAYARH
jgi:hypothetical protein